MHGEDEKVQWKSLKERDHLENLDADTRITLCFHGFKANRVSERGLDSSGSG
jgi:hypothetical protein